MSAEDEWITAGRPAWRSPLVLPRARRGTSHSDLSLKEGENDMKTHFVKVRGRAMVVIVALFALAAVAAACGNSSSSGTTTPTTPATSPAGTGGTAASVSIQNFAFTPKTLTISLGTTVTWTNNDSTPHDVMSTKSLSLNSPTTSVFASSTLSQGQTFSFTFSAKGVYFYECSIHKSLPAMHAVIVVK
jgi:plastocyanin